MTDTGDTGDSDDTVSWRAFLAEAARQLAGAGIESASSDARRIVEQASGNRGADLVLGLDEPATVRGVAAFDRMVARRAGGEPLQYVLGEWSFRTLDLFVDRRVLIPRPETEMLVEHALVELDRLRAERRGDRVTVVDLGTGSGAVALAIAVERHDVEVWATDLSADALDVARSNLAGIGRAATRVRLAHGSWFDALDPALEGGVDLIVSNPPYIAAHEELPHEVRAWEPTMALVSGPTGREALEHLVADAPRWLRPTGVVVLELAPAQAAEFAELAGAVGFGSVTVAPDLAGRDRVLIARR